MRTYLKVLVAICVFCTIIDVYMVWACYDTTMKFYEYWDAPGQAAEEASAYYRTVSEWYFFIACITTIGLVVLVGFILTRRRAWVSE